MSGFASKHKGQANLEQVDREEVRRILTSMPVKGKQEALRSVFVGDCVVRSQTKHWQGHCGNCICGPVPETRTHVFWDCPISSRASMAFEARELQGRPAGEGVAAALGLPLLNKVVEDWRSNWKPEHEEPEASWKACGRFLETPEAQPDSDRRLGGGG